MPRETFISLDGIGNWLRRRGYSQNHVFELLRKGELKAVIQHPEPLQPFPIPSSEWQKVDYSEFHIEEYSRDGGRRRAKVFYIDDGFAYDLTVSRLKGFLELAKAEDLSLLDCRDIDVHLPGEIRRNDATLVPWAAIHSALVERLVSIAQQRLVKIAKQGYSRSRVFVFSSDFDEFQKTHKIKAALSTAGRQRIAKKDNVWAEILRRYYTITKNPITNKTRPTDIVDYARRDLSYTISVPSVEDILRVVDELSVSTSG